MSWELLKTQPQFAKYLPSSLLDGLYAFPNFLYVVALQAIAALLLLVFPRHDILRPAALTVTMLVFLLDHLRNRAQAMLGADGMYFLVFGALALREIAPENLLTTQGCLWFIALQSCLSYTANGMLKLPSPHWRQGKVLWRLAHHPIYGNATLVHILRAYPALGKWLGWSAIGCELTFPCVLVVGYPGCWLFVGWGLLFHMSIAVMMGLNTFLFAWVATYPAILCVARY